MKVNIYYGGRGIPDDPSLYVTEKMKMVLGELHVEVDTYNIYEYKNSISTLPATLKDVDGVILAATVEWLGLGGYMYQFLDALWLYGDKQQFPHIYMQAIVMSTTYGEREGQHALEKAWEILGGLPCEGLCGYVKDLAEFKANLEYSRIIEKKAENLYRTISQKTKCLPTSNEAVTQSVQKIKKLDLNPQESEQLAQYASDDEYVKQQKEDIEQLAGIYKTLLKNQPEDDSLEYTKELRDHFVPQNDFEATYQFVIAGIRKPLFIRVDNDRLELEYIEDSDADVVARLSKDTMDSIVRGRETFQKAFSVGDMTTKGNFSTMRMLDKLFVFE